MQSKHSNSTFFSTYLPIDNVLRMSMSGKMMSKMTVLNENNLIIKLLQNCSRMGLKQSELCIQGVLFIEPRVK